MTTEAQAKSILVSLFNNSQCPETLKITLVDEFVADISINNMSFHMSFNSLKQALQDNVNNNQLANIIMYSTGCMNCIKSCLFP